MERDYEGRAMRDMMAVEGLDSYDIVISKGETHITNIEITWHDLWHQDDIQLAKAAVDCLVWQVPCPVCGKVMEQRSRLEGAGMGMTMENDLRCKDCFLTVDLPSDYDMVEPSEALYRYMHRYMDKVAKPTRLTYSLCITRKNDRVRAWFGVKDPDTGDVLEPEAYKGRYLWEDRE